MDWAGAVLLEGRRPPERAIPGGLRHLANPPVRWHPVPAPVRRGELGRADMRHGVPIDERTLYDRDGRQPRGRPRLEEAVAEDGPVLVRSASPRHITVPASTAAEPVRVCGRNPCRTEIRLLNEDTATDIRIADSPSGLAGGGGALVPWPSNWYLSLDTQDELYAIGATGAGTPKLSIIEVFEAEERAYRQAVARGRHKRLAVV